MKLKNDFVTYPVEDKEIMVGTGSSNFKGMVKANSSAAFILSCLKEETTEEAIIARMLEKYDVDRETLVKDVGSILETLRKIGALDE